MIYHVLTSVIFGASFVLAIPGLAMRRNAEAISMVDLTYIGPITPGGKNYTLVGDAKGIYDQIMQLNPSYNIDDFNLPRTKRDLQLVERVPIGIACNVSPNRAGGAAIRDGISHLISLGAGGCYLGPKPACSRVSCSWNSAIYLCNDNTYAIAPSYDYLGYGMAQAIYNTCQISPNGIFSGQAWDEQNYNVIISASNNFGEGTC